MTTTADNGNGVIYITSNCGKTFGLVSAFKITDEDGIEYENGFSELEGYFDVDQDWESEAIIVNTDDTKIKLTVNSAEIIDF